MARKNTIQAFSLITDGDMSGDITSLETSVKNLDVGTIRLTWDIGGTPVGEIKVQGLQEREGKPVVDSDWFDVSFGSTLTIDNTETEHQLIFTQLPFDKIRLKYTSTSGTGTLNAKVSAKQVGG